MESLRIAFTWIAGAFAVLCFSIVCFLIISQCIASLIPKSMSRKPTWRKLNSLPPGFEQFYYLTGNDVYPAIPPTQGEMVTPWTAIRDANRRFHGCSKPTWDEAYRDLNEGRQRALRLNGFTAELNNGGLVQYFWNSTGSDTAELIADFDTVGCPEAAAILASASTKLFGNSLPPKDLTERRNALESYFGTHPFNDDDDDERLSVMNDKDRLGVDTNQLDEMQIDIVTAFCAWARQHPAFFPTLQ